MAKTLDKSLQDEYAPNSTCFGCGPKNRKGLKIKSYPKDGFVSADFRAQKHHNAFEGFVSGGIISVILDCHSNWSAAYYIMKHRQENRSEGSYRLPATVTAEYTVTFLRPTPIDKILHLKAKAVSVYDNKAEIETVLEVDGQPTAIAKGLFVAVREGHPAYDRWR